MKGHDNRDPKFIGEKIIQLRKKNPNISITEIADLVTNAGEYIENNGRRNGSKAHLNNS